LQHHRKGRFARSLPRAFASVTGVSLPLTLTITSKSKSKSKSKKPDYSTSAFPLPATLYVVSAFSSQPSASLSRRRLGEGGSTFFVRFSVFCIERLGVGSWALGVYFLFLPAAPWVAAVTQGMNPKSLKP
jgi:hypothetical protein